MKRVLCPNCGRYGRQTGCGLCDGERWVNQPNHIEAALFVVFDVAQFAAGITVIGLIWMAALSLVNAQDNGTWSGFEAKAGFTVTALLLAVAWAWRVGRRSWAIHWLRENWL